MNWPPNADVAGTRCSPLQPRRTANGRADAARRDGWPGTSRRGRLIGLARTPPPARWSGAGPNHPRGTTGGSEWRRWHVAVHRRARHRHQGSAPSSPGRVRARAPALVGLEAAGPGEQTGFGAGYHLIGEKLLPVPAPDPAALPRLARPRPACPRAAAPIMTFTIARIRDLPHKPAAQSSETSMIDKVPPGRGGAGSAGGRRGQRGRGGRGQRGLGPGRGQRGRGSAGGQRGAAAGSVRVGEQAKRDGRPPGPAGTPRRRAVARRRWPLAVIRRWSRIRHRVDRLGAVAAGRHCAPL